MSRYRFVPWIFLLLTAGCTAYPHDPQGTLNRVRGGTLRAGCSQYPPWMIVGDTGYGGVEKILVERFARSLDARVEWLEGPESVLMHHLGEFRLDMVAAGLNAPSPWEKEVGMSRYFEQRMIAVPPGENAFLVRFERWLDTNRRLVDSLVRAGTP